MPTAAICLNFKKNEIVSTKCEVQYMYIHNQNHTSIMKNFYDIYNLLLIPNMRPHKELIKYHLFLQYRTAVMFGKSSNQKKLAKKYIMDTFTH